MSTIPSNQNSRALAPTYAVNGGPPSNAVYSVSSVAPPSQFAEYWLAIRRNIPLVVAGALLGTLAGSIIVVMQRPAYLAKAVLDIRSLNENFLNSGEASSTGPTQSVLPESYIQTEIKILQSQSIRDRAMLAIPGVKEKTAPPPKPSSSPWLSFLAPPSPSYAELVADAGRRVKVRAAGNTRIVEISCEAQDGQIAATVCNTLAQTYIANNLESRHASASDTSAWLQSQLDDARRRLNQGEQLLKEAGTVSEFGQESPTQAKLHELQTELSRNQAERRLKESNYEVASRSDAFSLPAEMDSGPVRQYRLQLAELMQQRSKILATKTPEHMEAKENALQIEEAERALQRERDGLTRRLRSDLELTLKRERMISEEYDQQASHAAQLDDKAIRYNMIKRDVDSSRRLYETLLQKVGEVGIAAAMRTSSISIVDPAKAPVMPYSPSKTLNLGAGFLGGAFLSVVLAIVRMRTNHTIDAPGESAIFLQVRELGVIPSLKGKGMRIQFWQAKKRSDIVTPQMSSRSIALATWLRVPEIVEAVNSAMNSLLLTTESHDGGRVTVLTSPEPGDGKTTVAANLAVSLAQMGRRVVLIEGDLRQPKLHTLFDVAVSDGGVATLLSEDRAPVGADLRQFLIETSVPGLSLLPSKPLRDGILRRLHSQRMRELVECLSAQFDEVVIDSPPILLLSDARVLGSIADGVLLIVRSRKTSREAALAAYDRLFQDGTRVFGTILNGWDRKAGDKYPSYSAYFKATS